MSDYNDNLLPDPCLRMDTYFGDEYESIEFGDGTGYIKAVPTLARIGALYVELDKVRERELIGDGLEVEMREMIMRMHRLLAYKCDAPHEAFHGKPCESCAEDGSEDCPKIIAKQMHALGIEVES